MNRFSVPGWMMTLALMTAAAAAQTSPANPLYLDPAQPVEVRVNDLVSRMTLEEKISQLVNQSREIPRLQVPTYDWWSEALHGIAGPEIATVFPEPIALAATFDAPLIHQMGAAIGTEGRAKHNIAVRRTTRSAGRAGFLGAQY
jgi:beta-glucosidase